MPNIGIAIEPKVVHADQQPSFDSNSKKDEIVVSKVSLGGFVLVYRINETLDATIEAHRIHIQVLEDLPKKLQEYPNPREEKINLVGCNVDIFQCVLGLVAKKDMDPVQMDVKRVILHGDLHEDIYMQQPEGFVETSKQDLVCKLKKTLYGLKQSYRE